MGNIYKAKYSLGDNNKNTLFMICFSDDNRQVPFWRHTFQLFSYRISSKYLGTFPRILAMHLSKVNQVCLTTW